MLKEWVEIPRDILCRIEGKSSLARIGLLVHSTAGFVDPGWKGHLTLELANILSVPIVLDAGMSIAQLSFSRLETPAERMYGDKGGKYHLAEGPQVSKYHLNYKGQGQL